MTTAFDCTVRKPRIPPEPPRAALVLARVLHALSDPMRLNMVRIMAASVEGRACGGCACPNIPKSTLAHHFKVLREAGVISSKAVGTSLHNSVRTADLDARFPGVLAAILAAAPEFEIPQNGTISTN